MKKRPHVLVIGATGRQGGAVVEALLERNHLVRALTRHPESKAAKALAAQGVKLVRGNLLDRESLEAAATGVDSVFAVTTPYEGGPETEIRMGHNLADACRTAGIRHLVYSSVAGIDVHTGVPFFDSKREIEQYIERQGLPFTFVRPANFMENVLQQLDALKGGVLRFPLASDFALQQIAVEDIGRFAALALIEYEAFEGHTIELASDAVTGPEMAAVLSQATGLSIAYESQPKDAAAEPLRLMYEFLERGGIDVDIAGLRGRYPDVGWHTFEDWARGRSWVAVKPQRAAYRVEPSRPR